MTTYNIPKTKREVLSEIIALIVLLAFAFKAYTHESNSQLFTEQAERLHLSNQRVLEQYRLITDIRKEIDIFVKHEPIFNPYLDEICDNVVGSTMLKLLVANIKAKGLRPLRIRKGQENQFFPDINTVHIAPKLYGPDGYNTNIFCGINRDGALVEKRLTMCDGIFHELCHAFHTYSHKEKFTTDYLDVVYAGNQNKYLWTDEKSEI
jgi:hypothetical protein